MKRALICIGIVALVIAAFVAGAFWRTPPDSPRAEIEPQRPAFDTPASAQASSTQVDVRTKRQTRLQPPPPRVVQQPAQQPETHPPETIAARAEVPPAEIEVNRDRWWLGSTPFPTAAAGASVQGTAHWLDAVPRRKLHNEIDPYCARFALTDDSVIVGVGGALQNVVVWVSGIPAPGSLVSPQIYYDGCTPQPRVQTATPGALIDIANRDSTLHNVHVYTDDGKTLLNKGLPRAGDEVQVTLDKPGVYKLRCDVHPWERAYVFVSSDAAILTGPDGKYSFGYFTPGVYAIGAWHEIAGKTVRRIVLQEGSTEADVNLKPPDKTASR